MQNTPSEHNQTPQTATGYRVERLPGSLRIGIVVASFLFGTLFFVGAGLGLMFELDGFGIMGDPRPVYVGGYIAALVVIPMLLLAVLWLLFPRANRKLPVVGIVAIAFAAASILFWLGISPFGL